MTNSQIAVWCELPFNVEKDTNKSDGILIAMETSYVIKQTKESIRWENRQSLYILSFLSFYSTKWSLDAFFLILIYITN